MDTDKISGLTEKINKTLTQGQFPKIQKIEFDLLMQHIRELYDELDAIRNDKNEPDKKNRHNSIRESMQPEELLVRRTLHTNEHFLLNDIHPKQEEPVFKKAESNMVVKPEHQTPVAAKASINESIKHPGSLNEKLKSSSGNEVHKAIASKHLKDMIDLNKKFVFVNELFKGNKEQFSNVVQYIDDCPDYASAEKFIHTQLGSGPHWDPRSESLQLFMNMVRLKFGME